MVLPCLDLMTQEEIPSLPPSSPNICGQNDLWCILREAVEERRLGES